MSAKSASSSSCRSLVDLPDAILGWIAEHLSLIDLQHLCTSCQTLRRRSDEIWSHRQAIKITSCTERTVFTQITLARPLTRLRTLDYGSFATDGALKRMINARIPSLQAIYMVRSLELSNTGLRALSSTSSCHASLEEIDITYCRNTSYAGTFCLRDNFPNLRLLRRQPQWMDGRYDTPFANDGLHTYYADGSFEFERQTHSRGFVTRVRTWWRHNPFFVFEKLHFSNPRLPSHFLRRAQYVYRPEVSLLRINDSEVLVGQTLRGLYAPEDYPLPEHVHLLPETKSSIYFSKDGTLLSGDHSEEVSRRHFMVSRIQVFPLETTMPPAELVAQNREACDRFADFLKEHTVYGAATLAHNLHRALGGD